MERLNPRKIQRHLHPSATHYRNGKLQDERNALTCIVLALQLQMPARSMLKTCSTQHITSNKQNKINLKEDWSTLCLTN